MEYDSAKDTKEHIKKVSDYLHGVSGILETRGLNHDASKLQSPEKEIFDVVTPLLKDMTYGSDEYKKALAQMGPALKHHYENNRHHPEHFENGVNGMTLIDLIEMICDWKAASERHADGDIYKSLEINKRRFGISDQLAVVLENTVDWLWEK